MDKGSRNIGRSMRLAQTAVLTAVLALGASACSDSESPSPATAEATQSDAKKATEALDEGLKAHAAGDLEEAVAANKTALDNDATGAYCCRVAFSRKAWRAMPPGWSSRRGR
jgi:Tfp pilus assembly protein PilF